MQFRKKENIEVYVILPVCTHESNVIYKKKKKKRKNGLFTRIRVTRATCPLLSYSLWNKVQWQEDTKYVPMHPVALLKDAEILKQVSSNSTAPM